MRRIYSASAGDVWERLPTLSDYPEVLSYTARMRIDGVSRTVEFKRLK